VENSKIILINGKKRSGKDYTAQKIKEVLEDEGFFVEIIAFADPIKEIIATTFGMSLELLNIFKNNKQKIYVEKQNATEDEMFLGDNLVQISDFRTILQRFGTEGMQGTFGKNVWVDLLKRKVHFSCCDYVIVPDFRFNAEDIGDYSVNIFNSEIIDAGDSHASENELNNFKFDFLINNTGRPDLTSQIQILMGRILNDKDEFLIP